jgi:DUF4097 and DUF4098 domain-containing protein YvlB
MRLRHSFSAVALLLAFGASGANLTSNEKIVKEIPLDLAGSFWVDNPSGDIDIVGSDKPNIGMTAIKSVVAVDKAALEEGRDATQISIEGDSAVRLVRTAVPAIRNPRWSSKVNYTLRVPRWVHIKVISKQADRIRVANTIGNVAVKGFNGTILLEALTGATTVDTTNGQIIYHYAAKPSSHARLTTLNGDIEASLPGESSFDWVADTLSGDLRTTLPVRGRFSGTAFHASVNSPGGPTLTTQTLLGTVFLLQNGTTRKTAKSIIGTRPVDLPRAGGARAEQVVKIPLVAGNYINSFAIMNIEIGEIRGEVRVDTRAGAITLDKVWGNCNVTSLGGPLNLGDIVGSVFARTQAGDVLVRAAREGGQLITGGGSIRLLYTGGATSLRSAGGDIVVGQAAGSIEAETRSGDITITSDPNGKSQHFEARTTLGNILLNLTARFGADVDATVLTSNAEANAIRSDFRGLTTTREQVGGKTRIHATGKINGGGEKLVLYAEEGDIHLSLQTGAAINVTQ